MGKAQKTQAGRRAAADEAEEEDDVPSREGPPSGKAKKGKKHADDDWAELDRLGGNRKERIMQRFGNFMMYGLVLEILQGRGSESTNGSSSAKDSGKKKKGPNSGKGGAGESDFSVKSMREKANTYAGPVVMGFFMLLLFAIRAGQEGFHPADADEHGFNFYEVMGLTKGVDQMEIRKAYKALALKYHPDKNPDCKDCAEVFGKISKAYDTLSNPEARKAYDSGRRAKKSLESQSSVELTAEDFEAQVLRSNEVWYVQAYDPNEGNSKAFSTGWEDVAHTYESSAKFGRLDVSKPELKALLPLRLVLLPVVFRYARGMPVESWKFSERDEESERGAGGAKALMNFMESTFPEFQRLETASELKTWWARSELPRILVVGPSSSSRAAKATDFMPVQRLAHVWKESFSFASASADVVTEALGSEYALGRGQTWALVVRGSGEPSKTEVRNVRDAAPLIQDFISEEIVHQAPVATVRNYQQLCGDTALTEGKTTYCLLLVDAGADRTAKALKELASSQSAYYQEVQELRNSGEDAEEPFRIQPVQISTSLSCLPWNPAGPGASFSAVWAEASKAPAFVLQLETRKFAAVKTPSMNELFQNIAYEDLQLKELDEEGPSLDRLFPDPETTLRKEVYGLLSSGLGIIFTYVMVALLAAVVPECQIWESAACAFAAAALLMLVKPSFARCCLSYIWCSFSSHLECQINA